jgi:hypothetical protein
LVVLIVEPPECRLLQHNLLRHQLKKEASFWGKLDYDPELWIQDSTQIYDDGRRRWRPLRGRDRGDQLTTLVGVIDNPPTKLREYMVAAVTDSGREIPVAFGSLPRTE